MTIESLAKEIAAEANECCNRSDGWQEDIETFALERLKQIYNSAVEDAANTACTICYAAKNIRKLKK